MTALPEMPEWPKRYGEEDGNWGVALRYERARAEAAMARLRVAVPLLEKLYSHIGRLMNPLPSEEVLHDEIHEVLQVVGDLPKEGGR